MTAADNDPMEETIRGNVRDHGCHVMFIFDANGEQPDFAYSIGFSATLGQPEVLVYGLDRQLMHSMINETYRQCRDGLVLRDGAIIGGLLEGYECVAKRIPADRVDAEHFGYAMWFEHERTGDSAVAAYQIVWPGAQNGLFPWDAGADFVDLQPALYEPGTIH
jgi:hypothetical protein